MVVAEGCAKLTGLRHFADISLFFSLLSFPERQLWLLWLVTMYRHW
jgi:hypothetical protein